MQLIRKLIILKPVGGPGRGSLKLEALGDSVKGIISVYDMKDTALVAGIRVGYGRLYEYPLTGISTEIVLDTNADITERVECLVVEAKTLKPILEGSSDGKALNYERLTALFTRTENEEEITAEPIIELTETAPIKKVDIKEVPIEKEKEKIKRDFFESVRPQLDELFKCYPADKELMRSVPDSKWVRVNYDTDGFYVVGILYNGKRATHICYGVPGTYNLRPKQKSEWLPLDYADPEGRGYWVIFQDAETGETLF
jgi:hypothetical protein